MAKERKLQRLYIGEPSAEAVAAQMPDLILISATGGDSALALYDQLSTIAPTLIINYDDKSWQSLLTQLGEITGHEKQAAERIAQFDKQLAAAKEQIKLPPQPVTAIVYTAAAHSANLWDAGISTRADAGTTRLYAGEVARRLKRQPKPGQTP